MALHNLKIIIVDGGREGSYKSKNAGGNSQNKKTNYKDTPLYKMLNAKDTIKNKMQGGMTTAQAYSMNMGLRVAGQFVRQAANYYISDIGRRNGDSNYQAIINRQIEIGSDILSVGNSILAGATTGSMFGGIGAGIGAVLGATSSAISLGFKYAERERAYQHEMFKNNTSQAYSLARSNFQGFTGRLR